jgi:hypothetical protein
MTSNRILIFIVVLIIANMVLSVVAPNWWDNIWYYIGGY